MNKVLPRISIITPSYNQGIFIERTIQSVLTQSYPNIDYLVIDGGSTDSTLDILKKYEGRLRWISEPDKGQSDAINKGLRLATGEVLGYLNSDDVLLPGALQSISTYFSSHAQTLWVTGYAKIINEHDQEISKFIRRYKNFLLRHYHPNLLLIINFISQMSTFWRRSAMEKVGEFSPTQHLVMDYDYWLRLLACSQPGIIQADLACFRVHSQAKSSLRFAQQFQQSFAVARPHLQNPLLRFVSYLHNKVVVLAYRMFAK